MEYFSVAHMEVKADRTNSEDLTKIFTFEISNKDLISGMYLKSYNKYKSASIYGDDNFLHKDSRELASNLAQFYLPERKYIAYKNMVGYYNPDEDVESNKPRLYYIPIQIPIHSDFLHENESQPLKDIACTCFKSWSQKFKKFRVEYEFDELPKEEPVLWVSKIISNKI